MRVRQLIFLLVLGFAVAGCRSAPLPGGGDDLAGGGGGGNGGSGGAGGSGGIGGGGGSGGVGGGGTGGSGGGGNIDMPHDCSASCNRCPSGPCCGAACCNAGEWCDPTSNTCRCGNGPACSGGNICATGGPIQPGQTCGIICCGKTSPCPL
jgi:hypothetical protein